MGPLLPKDALIGAALALSASESEDLGALGLMEGHYRLALGEAARSVLILGGKLLYGGHLRPNGYTALLAFELKRYGRTDRPLSLVIPWSEHRAESKETLRQWRKNLGLYGKIVALDERGETINPETGRQAEAYADIPHEVVEQSLTSMRIEVTKLATARLIIGGKRRGYKGKMSGILEEAMLSIRARQPLYLAGGFGGATLDLLRMFRPEDTRWSDGLRSVAFLPSYRAELDLVEAAGKLAPNGLTDSENAALAATHRPSEIATLVSLGLGRLHHSAA